jgi:hypothetical protein
MEDAIPTDMGADRNHLLGLGHGFTPWSEVDGTERAVPPVSRSLS